MNNVVVYDIVLPTLEKHTRPSVTHLCSSCHNSNLLDLIQKLTGECDKVSLGKHHPRHLLGVVSHHLTIPYRNHTIYTMLIIYIYMNHLNGLCDTIGCTSIYMRNHTYSIMNLLIIHVCSLTTGLWIYGLDYHP